MPTIPPIHEQPEPRTPATSSPARRPALGARARAGGHVAGQRKAGRALSVSIALHLAVAAIVLQLLTFGHGLYRFVDPFAQSSPVEETLTYVEPAKTAPPVVRTTPVPVAERRNPREITGPVVGPVTAAPLATSAADTGSGVATGSAPSRIGAVDPSLRGATPEYADGRVWSGVGKPGARPARSGAEKLDSAIASILTMAADSLDSLARASGTYDRKAGDWTTRDKNGNRWGWDNAGIRLGKVTIPNALLSLLPLNAQTAMSGNATATERERRLGLARADIARYSTMGPGDAEFRKINAELRQRRERERRDRLRAPTAAVAVDPPKSPDRQNERK